MIGKDYLARQARTLLRMAKTASDPQVSGALAAKAADLKSKLDEAPPDDTSPPSPPDLTQKQKS